MNKSAGKHSRRFFMYWDFGRLPSREKRQHFAEVGGCESGLSPQNKKTLSKRRGKKDRDSYSALASSRAMRAFSRFAAFLEITPLAAALSTAEEAELSISAVAVLLAVAVSNFLIAVLVADLTILLRRVLCSITLTRLIADLMFGKGIHLLGCSQ